jgi:hypothetical protein
MDALRDWRLKRARASGLASVSTSDGWSTVTPLLLALVFLAGCKSRAPEEVLLPVSGKVTVDSKPLTLGWVIFYPDASKGNASSRLPAAEIQPDGTYTLLTNSQLGAAAGMYKVVVLASREPIPARPPPNWVPSWLHDQKYAQAETTDLQIEVKDSPEPGRYDLRLAR